MGVHRAGGAPLEGRSGTTLAGKSPATPYFECRDETPIRPVAPNSRRPARRDSDPLVGGDRALPVTLSKTGDLSYVSPRQTPGALSSVCCGPTARIGRDRICAFASRTRGVDRGAERPRRAALGGNDQHQGGAAPIRSAAARRKRRDPTVAR